MLRLVGALRAEGVDRPWRTAFWMSVASRYLPHRRYELHADGSMTLMWWWGPRLLWRGK